MPEPNENCAAGAGGGGGGVGDSGRRRCSCLPFCFWGASGGRAKPAGAPAKRRRRHRFRLRLSWLTWPWFFRKGGRKKGAGGDGEKGKKRMGRRRRLLLLLTTSLQPKKALASVVSGDSALLPAKVSSFGDAKKQNKRKPRPTVDDGSSGSSRQPQASTTAATASTRWSTAPAGSRSETSHPSPRPTDGPAVAGRIWRAPSRRHSFHQSDGTERPDGGDGGLWTAATTLGVIVLFGRVTAVIFLCSCLYSARFVRAWVGGAASAKAKSSGVAGGSISSSRQFGDPVGVAAEKVVAELCAMEECKKKVVMAGLLDRAGKTPSSRFGR